MCICFGDQAVDSGAECSVMHESVANRLPGRRSRSVNYLRGIGSFTVVSTSTLTTICVIDNINVEILFHILPDYEITSDVLIGANLLHETGLGIIITENSATLLSQPRVMHVQSRSPLFENINHDLTNESHVDELTILLSKMRELASYFCRFIPDFARTMVPLYDLTKQGNKWQWTLVHEEARQAIIHHLTSAPVLINNIPRRGTYRIIHRCQWNRIWGNSGTNCQQPSSRDRLLQHAYNGHRK